MTGENARLNDVAVPTASGTSYPKAKVQTKETYGEVLLIDAVMTYVSYGLLIIWGYISDFLRAVGLKNDMKFGLKPEDVSNALFFISFDCSTHRLERLAEARVGCLYYTRMLSKCSCLWPCAGTGTVQEFR